MAFAAALLLQSASPAWAERDKPEFLRDAHFGEALFYARQGNYFDAISRLDTELEQHFGVDEPALDTLHFHINDAQFSVGDFELSYGMHHKAGRALTAVIEGDVEPAVRNEAIYRLARLFFQKDQNISALHAIERIQGEIPDSLKDEIVFLRAQIYMVNGRFEEAEGLFQTLRSSAEHQGYAGYNLGLARLAQGKDEGAVSAFDETARLKSNSKAVLAIKDKANLTLAGHLMDAGAYQQAAQFFERVRVDGPFSNRALLGLGWAHVTAESHDKALVPWTMLSERHVTDSAVQDALLGVPYAYGKLGLHGRAALGCGRALSAMNSELDRLDSSIESIREGNFLKALVREEFKQDKNWVIKLRELPDAPETYYLMDLMASHDFQSSLQNYFDLEQLRKKLEAWAEYYASYEEIIELRRRYYEPMLPEIDEQFRKLDSLIKLRLEQRDRIENRLQAMLRAPRPEMLATADERLALQTIEALEHQVVDAAPSAQARINRLKGHMHWTWITEYDERLTTTFENLAELDQDIARLNEIYRQFVRTRQAATQSYQGYDQKISQLELKTKRALASVETLMLRQGRMLETMAVNELQRRSQSLEAAQVQARFAMAESYDRATMGESQPTEEPESE